jgi:hypothetical protein
LHVQSVRDNLKKITYNKTNLISNFSQVFQDDMVTDSRLLGSCVLSLYLLLYIYIYKYFYFGVLLHVLYQGYWKDRPSQQLFKVFIIYLFRSYIFGPRWPSSGAIHNYFFSGSYLTTTEPLFLCYRSYFIYGLANTAVVYLILQEQVTRQQQDIKILTRKFGNNGRSPPPPPPYLHETPENQGGQY